jgi:hypothetical protein
VEVVPSLIDTSNHRAEKRTIRSAAGTLVVSSGPICPTNTRVMMIVLMLRNSESRRYSIVRVLALTAYLANDFLFACQGRVYALALLGNFLLEAHAHRDQLTISRLVKTSVSSHSFVLRPPEVYVQHLTEGRPRRVFESKGLLETC